MSRLCNWTSDFGALHEATVKVARRQIYCFLQDICEIVMTHSYHWLHFIDVANPWQIRWHEGKALKFSTDSEKQNWIFF